ncbi:glycogen synthase [Desulfobacter latus]|uniref:starch synthase n=1 Tax=Desulfobacter latus TaxID=2292 RepID=A0A850SSW6_9BACT|nr:glycogen/starch synthase [Desulfobacter latus]NWH04484.1 glycogen/starch synthase [Desulfobacter latus]
MNILIVASENGGLSGGKVGGIGDVVRDISPEIAKQGANVTVVTPSYGFFHQQAGAHWIDSVTVSFSGFSHTAEIYQVPGNTPHPDVKHVVVDHPIFTSYDPARGYHQIYVDDPPDRPFATDATKFALFGLTVAEGLKKKIFGDLDCIHLHDWHAAFVLILRRFHPDYPVLRDIRTVYTIHNLALQGVRPFRWDASSLEAWYHHLPYQWADIADPRWPECINLMAAGIRLSDAVHTVSPSYAEEIRYPTDRPRYYGGEGLEADIQSARKAGRLFGILNGCTYSQNRGVAKRHFPELVTLFKEKILNWAGKRDTVSTDLFVAHARLTDLGSNAGRPKTIITSVSRVVEQKLLLMRASGSRGVSGLEGILTELGEEGIYILLGTGDRQYEAFLTEMSSRFGNFIFLNGYAEDCADALYANGDLFLMPSSFEPCGISQMLAMRDGQPCLVHDVGGLKDTVKNEHNGFTFKGDTVEEQVDNFVSVFKKAINLKKNAPGQWQQICENAAACRFSWADTINRYFRELY